MLISHDEALLADATAVVSGASAQIVGLNAERNGLSIITDPSGTGTVYLLLGSGTASATNFHVALAPGGQWSGQVSEVVWGGLVQAFGTGARIGVVEV